MVSRLGYGFYTKRKSLCDAAGLLSVLLKQFYAEIDSGIDYSFLWDHQVNFYRIHYDNEI